MALPHCWVIQSIMLLGAMAKFINGQTRSRGGPLTNPQKKKAVLYAREVPEPEGAGEDAVNFQY